jgi:hypothetical protein
MVRPQMLVQSRNFSLENWSLGMSVGCVSDSRTHNRTIRRRRTTEERRLVVAVDLFVAGAVNDPRSPETAIYRNFFALLLRS